MLHTVYRIVSLCAYVHIYEKLLSRFSIIFSWVDGSTTDYDVDSDYYNYEQTRLSRFDCKLAATARNCKFNHPIGCPKSPVNNDQLLI
jgi:hypothetical protein